MAKNLFMFLCYAILRGFSGFRGWRFAGTCDTGAGTGPWGAPGAAPAIPFSSRKKRVRLPLAAGQKMKNLKKFKKNI
jgi:hypothetical protein